MTPRQIQVALRYKNVTQAAIAAELGVTEQSVSRVVHKKIVSRRIMDAIAAKIGEDIREVFNEYFDPETPADKAA